MSPVQELTAGKRYYFELRHKEGGGGDHFSVAWEGPGFGRSVIESVLSIKNGVIPENLVNCNVLQKPIFRQKLEQYRS